jgi:aminoglycoside phosphotransferase (APT) family kinase protein
MSDLEDLEDLRACLPAQLRAPSTTITKIAVGLSGAGVYKVDAAGEIYVLKVAADEQPRAQWSQTIAIQRAAADAGVAPRVIHVDETRRAVVSEFVADRSFMMWFGNPQTRAAALAELGRTLRRIHDVPIPRGATAQDPLALLGTIAIRLEKMSAPRFALDAIHHMLEEAPPPSDRAPVLSHNDVNPTNLVYDGERIVMLDWDVAAPNDPLYDLAAIAMFLRMDDATARALLGAHDGVEIDALPPRFAYLRRLIGVLCGALGLALARASGYAGAGDETIDRALALGDFYAQLRTGAISLAGAGGRWAFGLALIKEALTAR